MSRLRHLVEDCLVISMTDFKRALARIRRHLGLFSRAGFGEAAEDVKNLLAVIYPQ